MLEQGFDHCFRGDFAARPGSGQAAMQRDRVEHFDVSAAPDHQPCHDVEAVEFRRAPGHGRQIPAGRRGWVSQSSATIQGAPALQHPPNGPHRGAHARALGQQLAVDGHGPILAQVAGRFQFAAQAQHELLGLDRQAIDCGPAASRMILPVHPIQPLARSAPDPPLHGRQTHVTLPSDRTHRCPATYCRDHLPASRSLRVFCLMPSSSSTVFSALYRPTIADTSVTEEC